MTQGKPTPPDIIERIVYLRDTEKLDWKVIAQRLGISAGTPSRLYKRHVDSNGSVSKPGAKRAEVKPN